MLPDKHVARRTAGGLHLVEAEENPMCLHQAAQALEKFRLGRAMPARASRCN